MENTFDKYSNESDYKFGNVSGIISFESVKSVNSDIDVDYQVTITNYDKGPSGGLISTEKESFYCKSKDLGDFLKPYIDANSEFKAGLDLDSLKKMLNSDMNSGKIVVSKNSENYIHYEFVNKNGDSFGIKRNRDSKFNNINDSDVYWDISFERNSESFYYNKISKSEVNCWWYGFKTFNRAPIDSDTKLDILEKHTFSAKDMSQEIFISMSNKQEDKIEISPLFYPNTDNAKDDRSYVRLFEGTKPRGGMWGSMPDESKFYISDWHRWCVYEQFRPDKLTNVMEFSLKPDAKVLYVKDTEDLRLISQIFPGTYSLMPHEARAGVELNLSIDWKKISENFDAIFVEETISVWDIPSIVVFNENAVESFKNYTIEEYAATHNKDLTEHYKAFQINNNPEPINYNPEPINYKLGKEDDLFILTTADGKTEIISGNELVERLCELNRSLGSSLTDAELIKLVELSSYVEFGKDSNGAFYNFKSESNGMAMRLTTNVSEHDALEVSVGRIKNGKFKVDKEHEHTGDLLTSKEALEVFIEIRNNELASSRETGMDK